MNTKRKKTKELIIGEQKRLEKLEKVPTESKEVGCHLFKVFDDNFLFFRG